MMHLLPANDERKHEEATTCWCHPEVLWNHPKTNEALTEGLVIHNAADARELVEQAERIKNLQTKPI